MPWTTCRALQAFLSQHPADLHRMSLDAFGDWLRARIREAERSPDFAARRRIRELHRQHGRRLRDRERRLADLERQYAGTAQAAESAALADELRGLEAAQAGLAAAVAERRAAPEKLAAVSDRLAEARRRQEALVERCELTRRLLRAQASYAQLRAEVGLTAAEAALARQNLSRGGAAVRVGRSFEQLATQAVVDKLVPSCGAPPDELRVLRGVTWGCARGEFDQVVVRVAADLQTPAEVLAIVESKRNINDLVHGFRIRQENLAWLTGDEQRYDPALYRTRLSPTGRFQSAVHADETGSYRFTPESFRRFTVADPCGERLRGLWFATARRPLLGLTSQELGMVLHRVSSDPRLDLETPRGLARFHSWVQRQAATFQTRDVLALYARREETARQILFVDARSA